MDAFIASLHLPAFTILGIVLIAGFYLGQVARRIRLPGLIGYMVLGVLLGPSLFWFFGESMLEDLAFLTQTALGFVAFSIGTELSLASLRRLGKSIILIIFAETFMAFFAVTAVIWLLTGDWPAALIFGAIAPASAPAGTVAVIQEYRAKGSLTKALYAVVGFDDGLAIMLFGFAAALAKSLLLTEATHTTASLLPALWAPTQEIVLSLLIGTGLGFLFCLLVQRLEQGRDMLIMTTAAVFLGVGFSNQFHLSLILTNLVIGFVFVNTRRESLVHRVTAPMLEIMPLLFILFFALAGAHLDIGKLPQLGLLGVVYILGRTAGLMGGAWLGAVVGRAEEKIRKYLGMGILSQAGVAIGLSLIVQHDFGEMTRELALQGIDFQRPVQIGTSVITSVTATCIVFEIIGPILTKIGLEKAGEIDADAPGLGRGRAGGGSSA